MWIVCEYDLIGCRRLVNATYIYIYMHMCICFVVQRVLSVISFIAHMSAEYTIIAVWSPLSWSLPLWAHNDTCFHATSILCMRVCVCVFYTTQARTSNTVIWVSCMFTRVLQFLSSRGGANTHPHFSSYSIIAKWEHEKKRITGRSCRLFIRSLSSKIKPCKWLHFNPTV